MNFDQKGEHSNVIMQCNTICQQKKNNVIKDPMSCKNGSIMSNAFLLFKKNFTPFFNYFYNSYLKSYCRKIVLYYMYLLMSSNHDLNNNLDSKNLHR